MIEIVSARLNHVGPIATRMRAGDVEECRLSGLSPKEALRLGLISSSIIWTAKVNGRPEAMFGVVAVSTMESKGRVWMLGTDEIGKHPVAMVRLGRAYTNAIHRHFQSISNHVPAHNDRTLRWLARLGYAIGPVDVYRGTPIRGFVRCADPRP